MALVVKKSVDLINSEEVSINDLVTFTRLGVKANGFVKEIDKAEAWIKVKYVDLDKKSEQEVKLEPAQILSSDFTMLKWAQHGFENIKAQRSVLVKNVQVDIVNPELPDGLAFCYALDGMSYSMALVKKGGVKESSIDLLLKDGKSYTLSISTIIKEPFKCRFSANLLDVLRYPEDRTLSPYVQKIRSGDSTNLLLRGEL